MIRIVISLVSSGGGVDERELAHAEVRELARLGPPFTRADYSICAHESENVEASTGAWESRGMIGGDARQSIWALVAAAARWAVEQADTRSRALIMAWTPFSRDDAHLARLRDVNPHGDPHWQNIASYEMFNVVEQC